MAPVGAPEEPPVEKKGWKASLKKWVRSSSFGSNAEKRSGKRWPRKGASDVAIQVQRAASASYETNPPLSDLLSPSASSDAGCAGFDSSTASGDVAGDPCIPTIEELKRIVHAGGTTVIEGLSTFAACPMELPDVSAVAGNAEPFKRSIPVVAEEGVCIMQEEPSVDESITGSMNSISFSFARQSSGAILDDAVKSAGDGQWPWLGEATFNAGNNTLILEALGDLDVCLPLPSGPEEPSSLDAGFVSPELGSPPDIPAEIAPPVLPQPDPQDSPSTARANSPLGAAVTLASCFSPRPKRQPKDGGTDNTNNNKGDMSTWQKDRLRPKVVPRRRVSFADLEATRSELESEQEATPRANNRRWTQGDADAAIGVIPAVWASAARNQLLVQRPTSAGGQDRSLGPGRRSVGHNREPSLSQFFSWADGEPELSSSPERAGPRGGGTGAANLWVVAEGAALRGGDAGGASSPEQGALSPGITLVAARRGQRSRLQDGGCGGGGAGGDVPLHGDPRESLDEYGALVSIQRWRQQDSGGGGVGGSDSCSPVATPGGRCGSSDPGTPARDSGYGSSGRSDGASPSAARRAEENSPHRACVEQSASVVAKLGAGGKYQRRSASEPLPSPLSKGDSRSCSAIPPSVDEAEGGGADAGEEDPATRSMMSSLSANSITKRRVSVGDGSGVVPAGGVQGPALAMASAPRLPLQLETAGVPVSTHDPLDEAEASPGAVLDGGLDSLGGGLKLRRIKTNKVSSLSPSPSVVSPETATDSGGAEAAVLSGGADFSGGKFSPTWAEGIPQGHASLFAAVGGCVSDSEGVSPTTPLSAGPVGSSSQQAAMFASRSAVCSPVHPRVVPAAVSALGGGATRGRMAGAPGSSRQLRSLTCSDLGAELGFQRSLSASCTPMKTHRRVSSSHFDLGTGMSRQLHALRRRGVEDLIAQGEDYLQHGIGYMLVPVDWTAEKPLGTRMRKAYLTVEDVNRRQCLLTVCHQLVGSNNHASQDAESYEAALRAVSHPCLLPTLHASYNLFEGNSYVVRPYCAEGSLHDLIYGSHKVISRGDSVQSAMPSVACSVAGNDEGDERSATEHGAGPMSPGTPVSSKGTSAAAPGMGSHLGSPLTPHTPHTPRTPHTPHTPRTPHTPQAPRSTPSSKPLHPGTPRTPRTPGAATPRTPRTPVTPCTPLGGADDELDTPHSSRSTPGVSVTGASAFALANSPVRRRTTEIPMTAEYLAALRDPATSVPRELGQIGDGLPVNLTALYGRQILEGLVFLKRLGFPYHNLHAGNVVLDDGVCRLTDYENSLLGLSSRLQPFVQEHARIIRMPCEADVVCFGHLLFEMEMGYEMDPATIEANDFIPEGCSPEVAKVLLYIFDPLKRPPQLEQVLALPFFQGVEFTLEIPEANAEVVFWCEAQRELLRAARKSLSRGVARSVSMHVKPTKPRNIPVSPKSPLRACGAKSNTTGGDALAGAAAAGTNGMVGVPAGALAKALAMAVPVEGISRGMGGLPPLGPSGQALLAVHDVSGALGVSGRDSVGGCRSCDEGAEDASCGHHGPSRPPSNHDDESAPSTSADGGNVGSHAGGCGTSSGSGSGSSRTPRTISRMKRPSRLSMSTVAGQEGVRVVTGGRSFAGDSEDSRRGGAGSGTEDSSSHGHRRTNRRMSDDGGPRLPQDPPEDWPQWSNLLLDEEEHVMEAEEARMARKELLLRLDRERKQAGASGATAILANAARVGPGCLDAAVGTQEMDLGGGGTVDPLGGAACSPNSHQGMGIEAAGMVRPPSGHHPHPHPHPHHHHHQQHGTHAHGHHAVGTNGSAAAAPAAGPGGAPGADGSSGPRPSPEVLRRRKKAQEAQVLSAVAKVMAMTRSQSSNSIPIGAGGRGDGEGGPDGARRAEIGGLSASFQELMRSGKQNVSAPVSPTGAMLSGIDFHAQVQGCVVGHAGGGGAPGVPPGEPCMHQATTAIKIPVTAVRKFSSKSASSTPIGQRGLSPHSIPRAVVLGFG
eukprot:jgi/Mesvir1/1455/Mv14441-RA.2